MDKKSEGKAMFYLNALGEKPCRFFLAFSSCGQSLLFFGVLNAPL